MQGTFRTRHKPEEAVQATHHRAMICEQTMSNVVNLNKFRKRKAKEEAAKRAETNKRVHGRDKTERAREELQKRKLDASLDGAHLESAPNKPEDES